MNRKSIEVAILMGSDSDLPVFAEAAEVLEEFKIPYQINVLSAHRTPQALLSYLDSIKRGVKVIIAGAGGAAHLPGVISAHVTAPVIGVPIKTPTLSGIDSLYSIVQMPPGIPVATVGINAGKNAGLLAIHMLSICDKRLNKKLEEYRKKMAEGVLSKNQKLQVIGFKKYLKGQHGTG